jgi:hypothetical protein
MKGRIKIMLASEVQIIEVGQDYTILDDVELINSDWVDLESVRADLNDLEIRSWQLGQGSGQNE